MGARRKQRKGWTMQEVSLIVGGVGVVMTVNAPIGSPDWYLLKLARRKLGYNE